MLTRFSVASLHTMTRSLAAVAMGREAPDLVVTGARLLSTFTDRIHREREIWIKGGRIAVVKPAGTFRRARMAGAKTKIYEAHGGIMAPGLVVPPGIVTAHDRVVIDRSASWPEIFSRHDLCFLTVVERHGKNGGVGHGLLRDFGLKDGAVASSVGHDAHNIVLAGTNEADLQVALATVKAMRGGVCVVRGGKVLARVPLPIAGLLSDRRATVVARETTS